MAEIPTGSFTPPGQFAMIELEDGTARLLIDVTLSEEHTFESDITDYPVESGGTISDNIRPKPITVTIEGLVTNTPLDPMRTQRGDEDQAAKSAQTAFAYLMGVYTKRDTVTLRTSLGTFKKMGLASLTVPRSKEIGDALRFNARFQQIMVVTNARVRTATRNTGGKRKLGTKPLTLKDEKLVEWRKGVVYSGGEFFYIGGSPIVRESETVYWIPNVFPYDFELPTIGYDPGNPDGIWFHSDKKTPLTLEERRRLILDLRRDLNRVQGTQIKFDESTNKTKKPIDVGASNRRPAFEGFKQ